MKQRNYVLLKETYLEYNGNNDSDINYDEVEQFLNDLYIEGICDETELEAYENIRHTGKCSIEEYEYVIESISLWNEGEYLRRLSIVSGDSVEMD